MSVTENPNPIYEILNLSPKKLTEAQNNLPEIVQNTLINADVIKKCQEFFAEAIKLNFDNHR